MRPISGPEPKSGDVSATGPRSATRLSTSLSSGRVQLTITGDGIGACFSDGRSLELSYSGDWTNAEVSDWLGLFAAWYEAEGGPAAVLGVVRPGLSVEVIGRHPC